ncbi:MAG TPA: nucleotide sugar dehydrogenase [Terriglobales bacterium]|jgi:UDPglucose 6-dehydrogenase|nr:nucleotide sugar dehydrogenase [Terriglobales bacterium]
MQIGVYGTGYLGTVAAACLADFGTPVMVFDEDSSRVESLAEGNTPFYERNLKDILRRNLRAARLTYSTELTSFAQKSQVIFFASDSYRYLEEITQQIAREAGNNSIFVIMTPVPVGTAARIEKAIEGLGKSIVIVSQPVFLTDGCAVEDFNWPDRIVLGTNSNQAVLLLKQVYRPLVMRGVPVIVTNHETAELVREASTAFVATKISFINELASLCEHVNADAVDLALALGLDKKIAPRCLQPGAGFGGAFVEADMDSLAQLAMGKGVLLRILTAAREVNRSLTDRVVDKLSKLVEPVSGKEVGILGLSFKPNTNSVAASSSIDLARRLLARGAHVRAYDPVAIPDAKIELNGAVEYCENAYDVAQGVDALVISTGWPEFRALDFDKIKHLVRQPIIIDTKNLLDSTRLRTLGFQYVGIGRA